MASQEAPVVTQNPYSRASFMTEGFSARRAITHGILDRMGHHQSLVSRRWVSWTATCVFRGVTVHDDVILLGGSANLRVDDLRLLGLDLSRV